MNNANLNLEYYFSLIYQKRKTIYKCGLIGAIIGIIIALSIPPKYNVEIILSPESNKSGTNNSLANMASMFGFSNINTSGQEAINSNMLPDIIKSTPFLIEMYQIPIAKSKNDTVHIPLYQYIQEQKSPWWNYIINCPNLCLQFIKKNFISQHQDSTKENTINNFYLTPQQENIINKIKGSLNADINKKTSMTIISSTFQDPLVAAIVADSAVNKLQKYIVRYQTKKALEDCKFLSHLRDEKQKEYYYHQEAYAQFIDKNKNIKLQTIQAEVTRLQNAMNIAYQIYSQIESQYQLAQAKVQEEKPVFAIIEPSKVPLSPIYPSKAMFTLTFMILACLGSMAWIIFGRDILQSLKKITH